MLQHVVGENGVEDVFAQGNCAKTHGFQRLIRSQWLPDVEQRVGADGFADIHIQAVLPPVLAAAKVEQRREGRAGWRGRNSERVSEDYFLVAPCKDFKTVPGQIGPLVGVRSQFDAGVDQRRLETRAAKAAVTRVVRELHRVDRPDLMPETLHRKHRRRIADMAIGDMGLDG